MSVVQPVCTLHLKCFPIKGEPRLVENISYRGYSPPKCICNGHVPHIHIPSKNMQFLLWNHTCHAMKGDETQSCTMSRVLTDSHHTMRMPLCDKIQHLWITSKDPFYKTNLFVLKPKSFWMLHLNDHLYTKLMCLFLSSEFFVSHRRLRTPRHFYGLSPLELCLTRIDRSFTRGGVYPYLLLPDINFIYHIIQPCNSVELRPT